MLKGIKKVLTAGLVAITAASVLVGCGAKVNGAAPAIGVNNEAISTGAANMYLRYQQAMNTSLLLSYGADLDGTNFWDEIQEDGLTYGEQFKDQIKDFLVDMVVVKQHAGEFGYTLSDDRKSQIAAAADKFMYNNPDIVEDLGIDQAKAEEMLELFTYQRDMKELMVADIDREVSDEEAARSKIIYSRIPVEEETKEQVMEDAEKLLKEAKKAGRIDDEKMKEIAAEINEGFEIFAPTISATSTSVDSNILEAVADLEKDGEYVEAVIEGSGYLYVVELYNKLDRDATDIAKVGIVNQRETDRFNELVEGWRKESKVETFDGWMNLRITDKDRFIMLQ